MPHAEVRLEENLTRDLSLESIAKFSGYSLWHFQHVFRATTGEPVMQYLRARRLTAMLGALLDSEKKLGEIAKEYRLESQAVFTACIEVSKPENIPAGMHSVKLPAGRYAVFTHKVKLDKLEHTIRYIYGSWLPLSNCELRSAPDVEVCPVLISVHTY